jgi:hypothetical protein
MKIFFIKTVLVILGILLFGDLIFLNFKFFNSETQKTNDTTILLPSAIPSTTINLSCPTACLDLINNIPSPTPNKTVSPACSCSNQTVSVKEYYVPLGSGSTNSISWTAITGAEAYVNPANYGKIKSITFEASMRVPTGNGKIYARLYNINDQTGIFESEVSTDSSTGARIESGKLSFSSANKLYRVQLRTDMGYDGILDLGRLKITIE